MKRLHVHVSVDDIETATSFYETLFGTAATISESDYAKWMLDEPAVNFAISARGRVPGLDHLGIQVDSDAELAAVSARLNAAGVPLVEQSDAACCYATGNKSWVADPSGVAWETFHTKGEATTYGEDRVDARNLPRAGVSPQFPSNRRA